MTSERCVTPCPVNPPRRQEEEKEEEEGEEDHLRTKTEVEERGVLVGVVVEEVEVVDTGGNSEVGAVVVKGTCVRQGEEKVWVEERKETSQEEEEKGSRGGKSFCGLK